MPTIESIADLIKIKDYNIGELSVIDWSKFLRFQYSGRYKLNGGASAREGIAGADARATSDAARLDPMYALDKPIYALEPQNNLLTETLITQLLKVRFTLHIDIDGTDPLNVVSGTVTKGLYLASVSPPHFIGQVTSNTNSGGVKHLVVENFSFQWPGSTQTINRLEIQLSGSAFVTPTADVTFVATATGQTFGPYSVTRESTYFHDVEVEFDREDGAVNVTSYNTHTHPDRPADLPAQTLTFASTFAKSGIQITASSGGNIINTTAAGANNTWSYQELHDAMEDHWSAFANNPQWSMWVFMAE
ncbi:MAG TPA: hypothetical protein VLB27_11095, partial [candidate division Zixibacteria bacterium]|nr:hypothetical protein [candidate division Zixibacteria bacterium]